MGLKAGFAWVVLLVSLPSFGAGFYCRSTDGYLVTVKQKVKKKKYVPSQVMVSYRNRGVLLTVGEEDIYYELFPKFIDYGVEGNDELEVTWISLQVGYADDNRTHLYPGEMTTANLVLWGKDRKVIRMSCYHYDPQYYIAPRPITIPSGGNL